MLSASTALAATLLASDVPSSIGSDPFTINVAVGGAASGTLNYLRVDLFKEGTTNYFGETYNGSTWYGGSTGSAYLQVTIGSDGVVHTPITARVGSPTATEYPGPGQYKLRIRRYTASGNPAGSDTQTAVNVNIDISATPTPTIAPTIDPTVEPTVEPTPMEPTIEPTVEPTVEPTLEPTEEPTPMPTLTETPTPTNTPVPTMTPNPHHFRPWKCFVTYREVKIWRINVNFPKLVCERT